MARTENNKNNEAEIDLTSADNGTDFPKTTGQI
jgi:hypothetical protein